MYFLFLFSGIKEHPLQFDKNGRAVIDLIEPRMIEFDKESDYALTKNIENSPKK